MTIIKISKDGKAILKKKADETVVPLAPLNTDDGGRTIHVAMLPSQRSKRLVNVFLLVIALLVLSAGIVGGVYLYKYMTHRHKVSRVTVEYIQDVQAMPTPLPQGQYQGDSPPAGAYLMMEEDIDIQIEEDVERIEVPQFDECKRAVVIHDFQKNVTVIVDNDDGECFLMDLDRNKMSPPRTLQELIRRYSTGYYMPKVSVVRSKYQVVTPALTDLTFAGRIIQAECLGYDSYKLEKKSNFMPIAEEIRFKLIKTFGYSNLKDLIKDQIFK